MKVIVLILAMYLVSFNYNAMKMIRKTHNFYSDETFDDSELGDFQKLLNKFNMMSSKTASM
jgi:hypothetical protein